MLLPNAGAIVSCSGVQVTIQILSKKNNHIFIYDGLLYFLFLYSHQLAKYLLSQFFRNYFR